MLGLIALLALIVNISADYENYDYNYYNNDGYGYQKVLFLRNKSLKQIFFLNFFSIMP
jgi:hypothetical protein